MRARRIDRGFGHPPLGAHRRLPREQIGKRCLGLARARLERGELGRDPRRLLFRLFEPPGNRLALALECSQRVAGIALQRLFAGDVVGQRTVEPIEFGQSPSDRVAPRPCGCQAMRQRMPFLADCGQRLAFLGKRTVGRLLRRIRFGDRTGDPLDLFACRRSLGPCALRARLGLDPARMEQPRLDFADLAAQFAIALGGAGLAAKLRRALLLLAQNFAEPGEVGLGCPQLLLGVLAARMETRNSGCFLEQLAALDRLCRDHRADLALADQRRANGRRWRRRRTARTHPSGGRPCRRSDRPIPSRARSGG